MLNGEYHPEEGWNDGLWVRENVPAVRHLQHGLHLPVPGAEVFVLPGQPGQGGGRWPQGKTLRLEIPGARGFTVTGTEKGFRKLPQDTPGDVTIRFKSPDDAFRVFTGQIGIAQAYAQHRFTLRGNMGLAMPFVRCVDIAEGYLFPAVLARRILKRRPKKEISTARVYLAVLFGR